MPSAEACNAIRPNRIKSGRVRFTSPVCCVPALGKCLPSGEHIRYEFDAVHAFTTLHLDDIETRNIKMPAWNTNDPNVVNAWKAISADYAAGASATVRAVIGQNLRTGNVWEASELPALMKNANVDRIIKIDPATRAEVEIFVRSPK